jgi:signal transduction histidine kinase
MARAVAVLPRRGRASPSPAAPPHPRSDGIGLKNTRERLRWLYGPDHSFELVLSNGGAMIAITLPLRYAVEGAGTAESPGTAAF